MKPNTLILIADDDADDREIIKDAFTNAMPGASYAFAENGDKVMEYLAQQTTDSLPSFILLDLNMPGKDGRETLKEIKSNSKYHSIPTIIFTTSSSHRDRLMAYELGANCFITKPDTFNKLVELANCIFKIWQ